MKLLLLLLSASLLLALVLFINFANMETKKLSEIRVEPRKLDVIPSEELIEEAPPFEIPEGIHPNQLKKYYLIDGTYYAIYQRHNLNYPIEPYNQPPNRSGILYANDGDSQWKILFEIKELSRNKNNPYNFWKEKGTYYTVIVDDSGAGSGEGLGKLVSINLPSKEWKILDCFYYVPESYIQHFNSLSENIPLSEGVKKYTDPPFQRYNGDYVFDKTLNKFVINERIEEDCTAFKLFL